MPRERLSLHPGGKCRFPRAETEAHRVYLRRRGRGLRVTARVLRVCMRRAIRKHYGEVAATGFRASDRWVQGFARRHGMSLRRKTNGKHASAAARIGQCRRWHARFRRRLGRAPAASTTPLPPSTPTIVPPIAPPTAPSAMAPSCAPSATAPSPLSPLPGPPTAPLTALSTAGGGVHPKWGRWLPEDRLSIDQVPCNLREGDGRTYADVGARRVWLAGSRHDDGKRFCTLQIAARCANGAPDAPRRGQPKLTILFRGRGQRVSAAERAAWHPDVHVRFQKKAWADEAVCADYALREVSEITAAARAAGRESVAILDNLHGHTTAAHRANLARNRCKRHLLPAGTTDELQLIDAGVGHALKTEMAHLHDEWLAQDDHLEMWTGEGGHIRRRTPSQPICPTPISPDPLLSPPTRVLSLPLCPSPSFSYPMVYGGTCQRLGFGCPLYKK